MIGITEICLFHVRPPFKTKEACFTALAALYISCCTNLQASVVFDFLAASIASSMPGYDFEP